MTKPKATIAFPPGLDPKIRQSLKDFLQGTRKSTAFFFQDDPEYDEPTVISLEPPTQGFYGTIGGDASAAGIAQISALQETLMREYWRIKKSDDL